MCVWVRERERERGCFSIDVRERLALSSGVCALSLRDREHYIVFCYRYNNLRDLFFRLVPNDCLYNDRAH